jgi:hypothetical protein
LGKGVEYEEAMTPAPDEKDRMRNLFHNRIEKGDCELCKMDEPHPSAENKSYYYHTNGYLCASSDWWFFLRVSEAHDLAVRADERAKALNDAWRVARSYVRYHAQGPKECCTQAQELTARVIAKDLKALEAKARASAGGSKKGREG